MKTGESKKGDSPTLMSGAEMKEQGYLQEANRLFFHRVGLALALRPDGSMVVLDYRDEDQLGVYFGAQPEQLRPMATLVEREFMRRLPERAKMFGDDDGIEPV